MKKFNLGKAVLFGVLIWGLMAIVVWGANSLSIVDSTWTQVAIVVLAGIISYLFASNIKALSMEQGFSYGVVFVVVGVIIDLFVTTQLQATLFSSWFYWVGYVFILFAPMFEVTKIEETKNMKSTISAGN